jgi:hypothetical protein
VFRQNPSLTAARNATRKTSIASDANGNAGTELSGRFIKLGGQYQFTTAVDRAPNEGMKLTHTLKVAVARHRYQGRKIAAASSPIVELVGGFMRQECLDLFHS